MKCPCGNPAKVRLNENKLYNNLELYVCKCCWMRLRSWPEMLIEMECPNDEDYERSHKCIYTMK